MPQKKQVNRPFEVRFHGLIWRRMVEDLFHRTDVESKCFLLCSPFAGPTADLLIPKRLVRVPDEAYEVRHSTLVQIDRQFIRQLLVECATDEAALLEVHTHPWATDVRFSHIDLDSDPRKFRATENMSPPFRHGTLVMGQDLSLDGHLWDPKAHALQPLTGAKVAGLPPLKVAGIQERVLDRGTSERFDRQIRMFGEEGQHAMAAIRVGLVGCGGLGSQAAQALAYLGVRNFVLVDPDALEESNANRVVGVPPEDFRRRKGKATAMAEAIGRTAGGEAQIVEVSELAQSEQSWMRLAECDVLIGATDSASARQFVNRLASAFAIPYVDGGVGIRSEDGKLAAAGGQVQLFVPGATACRTCLARDLSEESREQQTKEQRAANLRRGYVQGADVPNPQVVFLNGLVANMAAWEVVKLATGCWHAFPYRYFDLLAGMMFEPGEAQAREDCPCCSEGGWLATGADSIRGFSNGWSRNVPLPNYRTNVLGETKPIVPAAEGAQTH